MIFFLVALTRARAGTGGGGALEHNTPGASAIRGKPSWEKPSVTSSPATEIGGRNARLSVPSPAPLPPVTSVEARQVRDAAEKASHTGAHGGEPGRPFREAALRRKAGQLLSGIDKAKGAAEPGT